MIAIRFNVLTGDVLSAVTISAVDYMTFRRKYTTNAVGCAFLTSDNLHGHNLIEVINNPTSFVINVAGNLVKK